MAGLFARVAGMLLLPVYTRYMSPADYGIMDLLDVALIIASLFFGMRWGDGMLYQYFNTSSEERRLLVVGTNFWGSLMVAAAILPFGWILAPQLSRLVLGSARYTWYVQLMLINLCLLLPCEVGTSYFRGLNQSTRSALLNIARSTVAIGLLVILMVRFHMTVAAYLWASIAGTAVVVIYSFYKVIPEVPLRLDGAMLWSELKYGFPLIWYGAGLMVVNFGDRIFLRQVVSLSEIGVYALAYKFGLLVNFVQTPFELYWRSQSFALLKRENSKDLYVEICTYMFLVLATAATGLTIFLKPTVRLMVGPRFSGFAPYVPWIAIAYLAKAMADYFRTVLRTENRTHHEATVAAISTASCLIAYATLIPRYHVWGAVIATDIAFGVMMLVSYWFGQRIKPHDFEWSRMAKVAASGVVVSVIACIIPSAGLWPDFAIAFLLLLAYGFLIVTLGFLNADEQRLIRQSLGIARRKSRAFLAI